MGLGSCIFLIKSQSNEIAQPISSSRGMDQQIGRSGVNAASLVQSAIGAEKRDDVRELKKTRWCPYKVVPHSYKLVYVDSPHEN